MFILTSAERGISSSGLGKEEVRDLLKGKDGGWSSLADLLMDDSLQFLLESLRVEHNRNARAAFHLLHVLFHFCRALQVSPVLWVIRVWKVQIYML